MKRAEQFKVHQWNLVMQGFCKEFLLSPIEKDPRKETIVLHNSLVSHKEIPEHSQKRSKKKKERHLHSFRDNVHPLK